MNPSTIAIIPLVLAAAGVWAAWFSKFRNPGDIGGSIMFASLLTLTTTVGFVLIAALMGVVYFNSWKF